LFPPQPKKKKTPSAREKGSNSLHKEAPMGTSTIFLSQPLWTKLKGIVLCNGLSYHICISLFIVLNPPLKVNVKHKIHMDFKKRTSI